MQQRPSKTICSYPDDLLDRIVEVLRRATVNDEHRGDGLRKISRGELEAELLTVLHATGLALDGTAESVIWKELEEGSPTEKQLSDAYWAMAEAPNPLDPSVCTSELRSGMNAQLRVRGLSSWRDCDGPTLPTVQTLDWNALPDTDKEEIRAMARHRADYHHRHRVKPQRPRDAALDTAMYELAEIFLRHTGKSGIFEDVPHAIESRFIKFAVLALEPLSAHYEVRKDKALSRRWQRLRQHERSGPGMFPVPDPSGEEPD